ncbi:MAG: YraN family protein [Chloroflexi bacterium]|nr:YraN family protein [Chloroflexota bacterium]
MSGWRQGSRKGLGQLGEDLAVETLERAGMKVIYRNWRCSSGEIDIVAREGEVIVLVEVKTRRGRGAGTPEQGVDPAKQAKLCQLAEAYIEISGWEGDVRIDVVAVEMDSAGRLLRVSHWQEAVDCW